jgi:ATP-binding cassette subfamily C (CFTR/MRP) protein 1
MSATPKDVASPPAAASVKPTFRRAPNPEATAGLFSRIFFMFLNSIVTLGHSRPLNPEDLWLPLPDDDPTTVHQRVSSLWKQALARDPAKAKLTSVFVRFCRKRLVAALMLQLLFMVLSFGYPVLIFLIVDWMSNPSQPTYYGWIYAASFVLLPLIISTVNSNVQFILARVSLQCREAVSALVYEKTLKVSSWGRNKSSTGQIMNLMTADAQKVMESVFNVPSIFAGAFQLTVAFILLGLLLGPAVVVGFAVMLLMFPLSGMLAVRMAKLTFAKSAISDRRIKFMGEILQAIRILKYYAWEVQFADIVKTIRKSEMKMLRRVLVLRIALKTLIFVSPLFVSIATFLVYAGLGNSMSASTIFTALSLLNMLRWPMVFLPANIVSMIQGKIALTRVENFLKADDIPERFEHVRDETNAFELENASFSWEPLRDGEKEDASKMLLRNLTFNIPRGQCVAVVGPVGCGKSSFLEGLLNEMVLSSGVVRRNQTLSLAYLAQEPWIQNMTLQDNILFGAPYDATRYDAVITACALKDDISRLPGGHKCTIGEKGINLSGGQKARVALARVCYADCDIVVLDDPLSAVDAHVGRFLFEKVIRGLLLSKTVIYVTQHVHTLKDVDRVIVLAEGQVSYDGSLPDIIAQGFSVLGLEERHETEDETEDGNNRRASTKHKSTAKNQEADVMTDKLESNDEKGLLTQEEKRNSGMSGFQLFRFYVMSAGGWVAVAIVLTSFVISQVLFSGSDVWLSFWTNSQFGDRGFGFYGGIYAAIAFATAIAIFLRGVFFNKHTLRSARSLHLWCLDCVVRCPMRFFDMTPTGRVINRFSKDTSDIDDTFPNLLESLLAIIMWELGALAVIASVIPIFLVALVPICLLYYFLQRYYIPTSRELRRLDSVLLSPIFSAFGETITGVTTVRAFNKAQEFEVGLHQRIREHISSSMLEFFVTRWLDLRLGAINALMVGFAAVFLVIFRDTIDPSQGGLVMTSATSILGLLSFLIFLSAMVESSLNSIDRMIQYSNLEPEAALEKPFVGSIIDDQSIPVVLVDAENPPPKNRKDTWPEYGRVEFRDVVLRYRDNLDPVLKGISFIVEGGRKVGVVGRTGAGKSSLMVALFRMVELSEGQILIDGVDIAQLGLHDLRSKLTIIPQQPVLFSGTVRVNLDPLKKYSDDDLWNVLEFVGLTDLIRNRPDQLDAVVEEGGKNFSAGERQLFCMARALVKRSRVIVLDEATADIDTETDMRIQRVIRERFTESTVITIAHRLNTIIDSDRILVMKDGRVAEFDTPAALLDQEGSIFASLVSDYGEEQAQFLRSVAFGERSIFDVLEKLAESASSPQSVVLQELPSEVTQSTSTKEGPN